MDAAIRSTDEFEQRVSVYDIDKDLLLDSTLQWGSYLDLINYCEQRALELSVTSGHRILCQSDGGIEVTACPKK